MTGDKADEASVEALYAALNRGLDVTKGLKKVTPDMQTHKNPTLKQQGPVMSSPDSSSKNASASSSETAMQKKQPRVELENGKKWNVEYHVGKKDLEIQATDIKQTMYIYQCTDSTIQVKGKLQSITLDGCRKISLVVDSLISLIEIINCQNMQIQILGHLPMISIQKTDGCQVELSKESINAEFVSSRSSEMNIMIPTSDGDFIELPIPQQFKTVYDGKKLVTTVADAV